MRTGFYILIFLLCVNAMSVAAHAQFGEQCSHISHLIPPSRSSASEAHNEAVRERLLKACIRENKKEFASIVKRSEEIRSLSEKIQESFDESQKLTPESLVEIKRLESLVNSIRKDLKIKLVKKNEKKSMSTADAVKSLTTSAIELTDEIKKISRHTVSVVTIKATNSVLRIARFLRLKK